MSLLHFCLHITSLFIFFKICFPYLVMTPFFKKGGTSFRTYRSVCRSFGRSLDHAMSAQYFLTPFLESCQRTGYTMYKKLALSRVEKLKTTIFPSGH